MVQNILASANSKLALNLFKVVRKDLKGKNAFLSPLSISAALSMTQIGAREKNREGNGSSSGLGVGEWQQIHQQFQEYLTKLQQPLDVSQLSTVDRIFLEKTFTVIEDFTKKTKEWYLAGKLDKEFYAKSTSPKPFKLSSEQTIDVPTMFSKHVYGFYKDSELKFKAMELLYKGQELGMMIILPDEVFGLEQLVENLTPKKLNSVIKDVSLNKEKIQLYLPKF